MAQKVSSELLFSLPQTPPFPASMSPEAKEIIDGFQSQADSFETGYQRESGHLIYGALISIDVFVEEKQHMDEDDEPEKNIFISPIPVSPLFQEKPICHYYCNSAYDQWESARTSSKSVAEEVFKHLDCVENGLIDKSDILY